MFIVRCDNCGAEENARAYSQEVAVTMKPMFCEPKGWMRWFDTKTGAVTATLCSVNCDRAYARSNKSRGEPKKR